MHVPKSETYFEWSLLFSISRVSWFLCGTSRFGMRHGEDPSSRPEGMGDIHLRFGRSKTCRKSVGVQDLRCCVGCYRYVCFTFLQRAQNNNKVSSSLQPIGLDIETLYCKMVATKRPTIHPPERTVANEEPHPSEQRAFAYNHQMRQAGGG